jgi:hypothetical protein
LTVCPAPDAALDNALVQSAVGDTIFVLPTYTAMLEFRAELVDRGVAHAFWEDA